MSSNNDIIWTSTEAEAVTGGRSTQDWCASGVSINIDDVRPGDLYIATRDDDLSKVFAAGAVAAVVAVGRHADCPWPLLEVGVVFEALQDLARAARYKTHAHIIAVQSRDARLKIHDVLRRVGSVHEGGRHLSLGLAGVPENIDYGLFGFSPFAQSDIAVITGAASTRCDMLFETMPVHGTVLLDRDSDEFLSLVARAKAAGVQNILSFGHHAQADARIIELFSASNATRVVVKILGKPHSFTLGPDQRFTPAMLAGLLISKITGKTCARAVRSFEADRVHSAIVPGQVSLIDPALQQNLLPEAVFKVTNMIDLGFGRQTAILDNLGNFSQKALCFPKKELAIPKRVDNLNLMYTNKTVGAVRNAHDAIRKNQRQGQLEAISPDVLAPGDFVVFKDIRKHSRAVFSEALRLIPTLKKASNAV